MGGGIKGQGRGTAQGHISMLAFPIHCLCSKSGGSQLDPHSHLGSPQQGWMGMGSSQPA